MFGMNDVCAYQPNQYHDNLSELVARYQDRIYRYLLRMKRSQEDARELTQETFLNAY